MARLILRLRTRLHSSIYSSGAAKRLAKRLGPRSRVPDTFRFRSKSLMTSRPHLSSATAYVKSSQATDTLYPDRMQDVRGFQESLYSYAVPHEKIASNQTSI